MLTGTHKVCRSDISGLSRNAILALLPEKILSRLSGEQKQTAVHNNRKNKPSHRHYFLRKYYGIRADKYNEREVFDQKGKIDAYEHADRDNPQLK